MSRINGDKARSALQKRRRNVQRMSDRRRLAEIAGQKKATPKKS